VEESGSKRFEDRVVVIAGGSSGLGLEIAKGFARAGARVVIAARSGERLTAAAKDLGAIPIECDITRFESVEALASQTLERCGRVDIAVNSAGFEQQTAIREITPETLEPMVAVQFTGAVYFIRHMANAMRAGGSLITISSLTGVLVAENYAAYAGAKAGINHVTRIAASEYGGDGIRVNAVAPSVIETPMTAHLLAIPAVQSAFLEQTPLGRMGVPEDVTSAVLWLASDESSYITGQVLVIDGGTSTRKLPSNEDVARHLKSASPDS
jgi:NAD(P)-dependent dehydrogenase (short-subunit alcohol dehydrogenase family)